MSSNNNNQVGARVYISSDVAHASGGLLKQLTDMFGPNELKKLGHTIGQYPDGAPMLSIPTDVQLEGATVIHVTSMSMPCLLPEMLLLMEIKDRIGCGKLIVVLSYAITARDERKDVHHPDRVPAAPLLMNMLKGLFDRSVKFFVIDPHTKGLLYYGGGPPLFPVDCMPHLLAAVREDHPGCKLVPIAPDVGALTRYCAYMDPVAFFQKEHLPDGSGVKMVLVNKSGGGMLPTDGHVFLYDDMCASCGTIETAVSELMSMGFKHIIVAFVHGPFCGDALARMRKMRDLGVKFYVTDTCPTQVYSADAGADVPYTVVRATAQIVADIVKKALDSASPSSSRKSSPERETIGARYEPYAPRGKL